MNFPQQGLGWLFAKRFLGKLFIGALITGLLVYIITSPRFIKPLYQSEALIYVPLTVLSKQLEQQGIGFANDVEIDGHIQILQSARIRDSLLARFNFDEEDRIDKNALGGRSKLYELISKRVEFQKTRYNSVSIKARDHDPERAAAIANALVELGDIIKGDILHANRKEVFIHARTHFENKEKSVFELENKLDSLENALLTAQNKQRINNELFKLRTLYSIELQELAGRKNHLETIQRGFETALPSAYVISKALPEVNPVWPKRLLWTILAVFAYVLIALVVEVIKRDVR
ncbi:MAG: hypothetical protein IH597_05910 [Bacteroidales bacterium]|nr:hypothetical protein [Bacteroidales bacterium]